jgi:hypothetical protein
LLVQDFFSKPGTFAKFAAIRRASSRVNSPTARRAEVQRETYEIKLS